MKVGDMKDVNVGVEGREIRKKGKRGKKETTRRIASKGDV
jgi:hypothetical protein